MRKTLLFVLPLALAGVSLAGPVRSEVRVLTRNPAEFQLRLGSLLGGLDVCSHGRVEDGRYYLLIAADSEQLSAIRSKGLDVEVTWADLRSKFRAMTGGSPDDGSFRDFGYFFNYWEMRDTIARLAALHPQIAAVDTAMRSFQNRALWCLKISDHAAVNESEPQVFINGAIHGREPLSTHACIAFASLLCRDYGSDSLITWLVNNREIYVLPVQNVDGYVYNSDSGGASSNWRKNRHIVQSPSVGVDLNRNYGYKWGYDNTGSSPTPSNETYRGPSRFSEPETQVIRDFEAGHKIRVCLDGHTYGRSNIYPWGYAAITPPDQPVLAEMADTMAACNGYASSQASGVNGVSIDWEYADTLWNGVRKFITYAFTTEHGINDFWYGATLPAYVDSEVARNMPSYLYLTRVSGVYLEPLTVVVNDTTLGNANGELDPAESAGLWFTLRNRAIHPLDTAKAVTAVLLPSDTLIQVLTPTATFPAIPRRTTADNRGAQLQVVCSPNAVPGSPVSLRLEVTFTDDGETIMQPLCYQIRIGSHPSAVSDDRPGPAVAGLSISAAPNPTRSATLFRAVVSGAARGSALLRVYARDGHLAAALPVPAAERSTVLWNGRDTHGQAVAPGVYFARLSVGSATACTRIIRID